MIDDSNSMSHGLEGIVETVTDISNRRTVSQRHVRNLIEDIGFDPESAEFVVAMDGRVPPSTGEVMMSSEAESRERTLTFDALVRKNKDPPRLAVYTPTEADKERFATLPGEERDEIGKESTASKWLHDAAEVSNADCTILVSPAIVSIRDSDSQDHFLTDDFGPEDAQRIIDISR